MVKKYFNKQDIEEAYIKLKSYIYYDKNLFYKNDIATFEYDNDLEQKFTEILDIVNSNNYKNKINKYVKQISFYILPKKIKSNNSDNNEIVTNKNINDKYIIKEVNFFINAPIELKIIDTLWCMAVGKKLQKKFLKDTLYANILDFDTKGIFNSKNLFKKYFNQYELWRDSAIKKVENLYQNNKSSSVIFSLDIQKYYYNINVNYKKLNQYKNNILLSRLTDIIELIHKTYRKKIKPYLDNTYKNNNFLPIGLLSSGIIANWYLHDFDKFIKSNLEPEYYGRYVDDILCVFKVNEKEHKNINHNIVDLLEIYFGNKLFTSNNGTLSINLKNFTNLKIQQSKIKAFIIDKSSSKQIIEKFKSDIQANSSEFRFLPSIKELDKEYSLKLFTMNYDGSNNMLRNIDKFILNKYNIAVYLAKKIKIAFFNQNKFEEDFLIDSLKNVFQGIYLIDLYNYWYKIFEYLILTDNNDCFLSLYKSIQNSCIQRIQYKDIDIRSPKQKILQDKLKSDIQKYLKHSVLLAFALHPVKKFKYNNEKVLTDIKRYRYSNMIDNNRIFMPLFNYSTQYKTNIENAQTYTDFQSLIKHNYRSIQPNNSKLNEMLLKYSPICIYDSRIELNKIFWNILNDNYSDLATHTNLDSKKSHITIAENSKVKSNRDINIYNINFKGKVEQFDKIKFGIVNKIITDSEAEKLDNYVINDSIYEHFRDLLEEAKNKNCNLVIFPELAIPLEFLPLLYDEVRIKEIGIITGIKHFTSNTNHMYNLLCTLLPFKYQNKYKDTFLSLRVKNYYSPTEKCLIKNSGKKCPELQNSCYDLIYWRGVYFSSYNCFEITSLEDRSLFKGMVDFITINAFNRDVEYFNNISQAMSRDLHCCIVNVNNSNYGYSAVVLPRHSYYSLPIMVKGSEDDLVMTYTFDYRDLRKFQHDYLNGLLEREDDLKYKPLPPNYKISPNR